MRSWWREGRLCLERQGPGTPCVDISTGPLAELILAALKLPPNVQAIAHIEVGDDDGIGRLNWPQIVDLAADPNFPIII